MCKNCTEAIDIILEKNLYSKVSEIHAELFKDRHDLAETYGEALRTLVKGYANFMRNVFSGDYKEQTSEWMLQQQTEWEKHFDEFIQEVEEARDAPELQEEEFEEDDEDVDASYGPSEPQVGFFTIADAKATWLPENKEPTEEGF